MSALLRGQIVRSQCHRGFIRTFVFYTVYLLVIASTDSLYDIKCGTNGGTPYYLASEPLTVYQLNTKILYLSSLASTKIIANTTSRQTTWRARFYGTSIQNATVDKELRRSYISYRYRRLSVVMNKMTDRITVRYIVKKNISIFRSAWATLRLGKPPVLHLVNDTSQLWVRKNASFTLCFSVTGVPSPNISLFRTVIGNGIERRVESFRYNTLANCLEIGPVRKKDAGLWSVQATNCFNTSESSFRLNVSGRRFESPLNVVASSPGSVAASFTTSTRQMKFQSETPTKRTSDPLTPKMVESKMPVTRTATSQPNRMTTAALSHRGTFQRSTADISSDDADGSQRPEEDTTTTDSTALPLWIYILIAGVVVVVLVATVLSLSCKFCKKGSDYVEAVPKPDSRLHSLPGPFFSTEILYEEAAIAANDNPEYINQGDSTNTADVYNTVSECTGVSYYVPIPLHRESIKEEQRVTSDGYETVKEQQTSDKPAEQVCINTSNAEVEYVYARPERKRVHWQSSERQRTHVNIEETKKSKEDIQYAELDTPVTSEPACPLPKKETLEYASINSVQPHPRDQNND